MAPSEPPRDVPGGPWRCLGVPLGGPGGGLELPQTPPGAPSVLLVNARELPGPPEGIPGSTKDSSGSLRVPPGRSRALPNVVPLCLVVGNARKTYVCLTFLNAPMAPPELPQEVPRGPWRCLGGPLGGPGGFLGLPQSPARAPSELLVSARELPGLPQGIPGSTKDPLRVASGPPRALQSCANVVPVCLVAGNASHRSLHRRSRGLSGVPREPL